MSMEQNTERTRRTRECFVECGVGEPLKGQPLLLGCPILLWGRTRDDYDSIGQCTGIIRKRKALHGMRRKWAYGTTLFHAKERLWGFPKGKGVPKMYSRFSQPPGYRILSSCRWQRWRERSARDQAKRPAGWSGPRPGRSKGQIGLLFSFNAIRFLDSSLIHIIKPMNKKTRPEKAPKKPRVW